MNIHENHKRIIETTFWMLDELLFMYERWANNEAIHSILYKEENNLPDNARLLLKDEITSLRHLLEQVKNDLELRGHSLEVGKALQGSAALFMDNMDELQSHRLHSFGEPSPELTAYLNTTIKEFNKHLSFILKIGKEAIGKKSE